MGIVRRIASAALGDYSLFRVLALSAPAPARAARYQCAELADIAELAASGDPQIRSLAGYATSAANCFVVRLDSQIAAACCYGPGGSYKRSHLWPVQAGEARLDYVATAVAFRGRGMAQDLIRQSSTAICARGFAPLYALVYHSNAASHRAFERAGWRQIAWVGEAVPMGRRIRVTCSLRDRGAA